MNLKQIFADGFRLRNRFHALLSLAAVLLLVTSAASAQLSGKGAIAGVIQDPTGAAIPNATIVITSDSTKVAVTTTSTSSGDYSISTLDPGQYTVTVTAQGFEKLTQEHIQVNALETQTLNPKLTVGGGDTSVTVTTAPAQLETTNAMLGATMQNEMYSALPIQMGAFNQPDQRRATDFALLMPGVQGNETNGNATTNTGVVNGSGSRGAASAVYIDGLPFTQVSGEGDPRFVWTAISVDAVDQFQVETSGYPALYEGQGVQNYNVKHGSNRYHAAVYEFLRNTALDTWGFFKVTNPVTGALQKPVEHQNEYGIILSGPLVPFGTWKDKLFFFGNYNGFRYSHIAPQYITFPNAAEQGGNFQGLLQAATSTNLNNPAIGVFDPNTQTACTANSTTGPCRYRFGYVYGGAPGAAGNPVLGPGGTSQVDVIPTNELSPVALKMQGMIPTLLNQNPTNNYLAPNYSALSNWSMTDRIDYTMTSRDQLTLVAALGRQASSVPVGQTTAGRNTGPVPYNYGQAYAPKTAVGIIEETHTFSPHIVNQFKYGFARYNGPTINADFEPAYGASTMGITGLPSGQAQGAFPITTFAGTDGPTQWAGATASTSIANSYALVDNVQWVFGRHSLTIGGEIAWLQYQTLSAATGSTQLTIANAVTETSGINASSNTSPKYVATSGTGLSYASFLVGQIDKGSLTQYLIPEYGARFRPISPYIQDNWKVSNKLTLDLGLRYDFYPTFQEAHDSVSFFNPTLTNPATGIPGALQFAGTGANTCNCHTPVNNYYKNFGPRVGFAYQSDANTVWRGSFGVMYTHGNGVGGAANSRTGTGTLGFSAAPSDSATGTLLSTFLLSPGNTAFPAYTPAAGRASGNAYGTGYTTFAGYTGTPSGAGYADPYEGGRAPQYINWNFGFQHQWTENFSSTISYVGSEGHFLIADGSNARGHWADQLDPKYLSLGSNLSLTGTAETTYCATSGVCPSYSNIFNTGQALSTLLKPFPFYSVSDTYGNVANSVYNGLQVSLMKRAAHGTTFMLNYTWSRAIDDGGTFRTGYAIPVGTLANEPNVSFPADRIERTVSTSNQPHHLVFTGVENLPFGRGILGGQHALTRAIFGGFKFSQILQMYSGSPLAITASAGQTNPAVSTVEPNLNPAFSGSARQNGHWGRGSTYGNLLSYITPSTGDCKTAAPAGPFINDTSTCLNSSYAPAYTFGNAPRTEAYHGLTGPGNFDLDISLRRTFPLHIGDTSKLSIQADLYNVTNYVLFSGIGVTLQPTPTATTAFGVPTSQGNVQRSAQLSARIEF